MHVRIPRRHRRTRSPESGLVVQRLEDAGFLLCGMTNSPEFGTVTATENDRYGITRNPWDLERTSGGSSGGASAAVAGGMFTIAHASDGGGSIRIPATCTGLVGLKAARGRINDRTVAWEGASTQGVVSRTVADTAAALDAIAVPDPLAWWNAPPPERPFLEEVGVGPGPPPHRRRHRLAPRRRRSTPSAPPPCSAPSTRSPTPATRSSTTAFDAHAEAFIAGFVHVVNAGLSDYDVDWDLVQANNQANRGYAQKVDSLTYVRAVADLQRWTRSVNAQWGRDFDVLVTPTMPIQPAPAGQILREITESPGDTSMTVLASVSFTSMFNMNGLPAISLPVHQAADTGLPIGAQLVAGPVAGGDAARGSPPRSSSSSPGPIGARRRTHDAGDQEGRRPGDRPRCGRLGGRPSLRPARSRHPDLHGAQRLRPTAPARRHGRPGRRGVRPAPGPAHVRRRRAPRGARHASSRCGPPSRSPRRSGK